MLLLGVGMTGIWWASFSWRQLPLVHHISFPEVTVMQLSCTVKGTSRTLPYGYPVMETSNPAHTSPPKLTCYVAQIHSCWPEYEHQYWMQVILTSAHSTTLQFCDSLHANSLCSVLTDSQPHCQWHCMWTGTRDGGQHNHIY